MKMTMHIDEGVLAEVMEITGVPSKTKAVEVALGEMVRKHRLKTLGAAGLGLTAVELKNAWEDPSASPLETTLLAAEEGAADGAKRPGR